MADCCGPFGPGGGGLEEVAPFVGRYFVDPEFVGVSTGSSANPFRSFADAFALAVALGVVNGIVFIPAGQNIPENIVFPTSGSWEIACISRLGNVGNPILQGAVLSGTIDLTANVPCTRALTNLVCLGAITGVAPNASSSCRLRVTCCSFGGPVSLTALGTGIWRLSLIGPSIAGDINLNGSISTLTITGDIFAQNYTFTGLTSCSGQVWTDICECTANWAYTGGAAQNWRFWRFNPNAGVQINTVGGPLRLLLDSMTASTLYFNGLTLGADVTAVTLNANASALLTLANNLGATPLMGPYPAGLVVAEASMQILVPGTTGAAALNVNYTDLGGVARTLAIVPGLNVAQPAGTEARGILPFQKNVAGVSWSVTGIVTPGALSYSAAINLRVAR